MTRSKPPWILSLEQEGVNGDSESPRWAIALYESRHIRGACLVARATRATTASRHQHTSIACSPNRNSQMGGLVELNFVPAVSGSLFRVC